MGESYFVVTKPLQYFNATNIADQALLKVCIIVDLFYKSEEFYQNIQSNKYWSRVLFFSTSLEAYSWLAKNIKGNDTLYIDSDYGLKKTLWLSKIKSKNIYVYEEGTGSYRNDLIKIGQPRKILRLLLRIIGIKEHMGGGKYTKGIIIYDLGLHVERIPEYNKMRINFKTKFINHVTVIKNHFSYQTEKNSGITAAVSSKKILLYLTSWEYNSKVDAVLASYPDHVKILKPHPHIKNTPVKTNFKYTLSSDVFVELFILNIIDACEEIVVLHENSSAMQYLISDKIKSITFEK